MVDLIVHYVKHGDPKCSKCLKGFTAYWIGREHAEDMA